MNRCFPEAGPETTNLRWGIESILRIHNVVAPHGQRTLIVELEAYFREVVESTDLRTLSEKVSGSINLHAVLDEGALLTNSQYDPEE